MILPQTIEKNSVLAQNSHFPSLSPPIGLLSFSSYYCADLPYPLKTLLHLLCRHPFRPWLSSPLRHRRVALCCSLSISSHGGYHPTRSTDRSRSRYSNRRSTPHSRPGTRSRACFFVVRGGFVEGTGEGGRLVGGENGGDKGKRKLKPSPHPGGALPFSHRKGLIPPARKSRAKPTSPNSPAPPPYAVDSASTPTSRCFPAPLLPAAAAPGRRTPMMRTQTWKLWRRRRWG